MADEGGVARGRSTTLLADRPLIHPVRPATDQSHDSTDAREIHTQKAPVQPPNAALFSLFHSSLKGVHDREITITDFECEQLVSLIQQRERDVDEYPLPFSQHQTGHHDDEAADDANESKDMERHSESALSLVTSLSLGSSAQMHTSMSTMASQSQNTGSVRHVASATSAGPTRVTSPIARDFDTDSIKTAPPATSNVTNVNQIGRIIPKWRCFVRSLTSTHIMLCFVPATFDDLLLLVDTGQDGPSKRDSLSSKRSSTGGLSQSFSAETKSHDRTDPLSPPNISTPKTVYYLDDPVEAECHTNALDMQRMLFISRRAEGPGREILKRPPIRLSVRLSVTFSFAL